MRILEAGDWSLLLPEEWFAERDDDSIIIGDRDGVGCVEISELRRDRGTFSVEDLEQFRVDGQPWEAVNIGSFEGRSSALVEDDAAIREWYLFTDDLLLFVTHSCELENRGLDDAAVDEILSTLRYAPDAS